jgi:hypothetical protein
VLDLEEACRRGNDKDPAGIMQRRKLRMTMHAFFSCYWQVMKDGWGPLISVNNNSGARNDSKRGLAFGLG